MLGTNGIEPEPYRKQLFINDISNQTRNTKQKHKNYSDDEYLLPCHSHESLNSNEGISPSPNGPTTTPSLHTPDFLSHLNSSEVHRYPHCRKSNNTDVCLIRHKFLKNGDCQPRVEPKQTLLPEGRKSSASSKAVFKPHLLQPIRQNHRRSNRKKHQEQKHSFSQPFNVSGNAMLFDSKSKSFQNKDYNPGFLKKKSHSSNRCANRMSSHDHHSWLESFHQACRARRSGLLKSLAAGDPLLSICGSKDQVLSPTESHSIKLSLVKIEEKKREEGTNLAAPISMNQDSFLPALKNGDDPIRKVGRARFEKLEEQLEGVMITIPLDLEHIQLCDDCQRSWSPKLFEDDSSILIDQYILVGEMDTHTKPGHSSDNPFKMIKDDTKSMKLEKPDLSMPQTSHEFPTFNLNATATELGKANSLTNTDVYQLSNIKQAQGKLDNQEKISAEEGKQPRIRTVSRNNNDILNTEESSTIIALETIRHYTYSFVDYKNTIVYHPDSIISSSGTVSCLSKLPIAISSSDDELRARSCLLNLELNYNTSAIETKFTEADELDSDVDVKYEMNSVSEKESEVEDMEEDDEEEDDVLFYQMRAYPPNFFREKFALPMGKMLCYTAMTDKRYNKWSRRKKRSKRKTKKKARITEERPSVSSTNDTCKKSEKSYLRYLIKNKQDGITMRYRHESKYVYSELSRFRTDTNKKEPRRVCYEIQTQNFEKGSDSTEWNEFYRKEPVCSELRLNNTSPCIVLVCNFAVIDNSTAIPDNYLLNKAKRRTDEKKMVYKVSHLSLTCDGTGSAQNFQKVKSLLISARGKPVLPGKYHNHKQKKNFGEKEDKMQVGDIRKFKSMSGNNRYSSIVLSSVKAKNNENKQSSNLKCATTPIDCCSFKSGVTKKDNVSWFNNISKRNLQGARNDGSRRISSESNSDEYSYNSLLDQTALTRSTNCMSGLTNESGIPLIHASERKKSDRVGDSRVYNRKVLRRELGHRNSSIICPLSVTFPRMDIQIRTTSCSSPTPTVNQSSQASRKQFVNKSIDMKLPSEKTKSKYLKGRSQLDKDMEIVTIQDLLSDMNDQTVLKKRKSTSKKGLGHGATFREMYGKSPYTNGHNIITSREESPYKKDRSVSALSFTQSYTFSALPLPELYNFDKCKSKKHTS